MTGHPLVVVGIGHDGPGGLSPEALAHVKAARVLAGGRRHLDFFPEGDAAKIVLGSDVEAFAAAVKDNYRKKKTVVLASGDPLFYGIGRALLDTIPREDLSFLPQVCSVQLAFARIKETWHDARVVSLHGRPLENLIDAIEAGETKIAVLADAVNAPCPIAGLLRRLGAAWVYVLWVCENLGGADEQVSRHDPASMSDQRFSPLNVVVLLRRMDRPTAVRGTALQFRETRLWRAAPPLLGIPEAELLHQGGMVTRREIRLMALCYLELRPGETLWDVGAGSGSVSLEAARLSSQLRIFAIERDDNAFGRLKLNVEAFDATGVHTVHGAAPEAFANLPPPDTVFIGGSGGRLDGILHASLAALKPGGRIVVNCIALETLSRAWQVLRDAGLEPQATSVQLAHSRPLGRLHSLEPDNPIFIVRARKP
jgi:precorrin-6Y C5,15-methyltransferase (decarboxylating)